ncbi:MAG: MgtC/SapB family protein [Devosia sp.]|nr:MgtC/SapB family protein [Devosia sp.]
MVDTVTPLPVILIRLLMALLLGGIIGFERQVTTHSAGLRTHILISLAACLYTILTLEIFHLPDVMTNGRSDPVHSVEAVTAGIAFLGAGAIFRNRSTPKGLTTGAGMWLAGALGMTAALGYYFIGLAVAVMAVVVLLVLKAADVGIDRRLRARLPDAGKAPPDG